MDGLCLSFDQFTEKALSGKRTVLFESGFSCRTLGYEFVNDDTVLVSIVRWISGSEPQLRNLASGKFCGRPVVRSFAWPTEPATGVVGAALRTVRPSGPL